MALDLLVLEKRPHHTYGHDSRQSFLWTFWEVVLNYRAGVRVARPPPNDWVIYPLSSMRGAKWEFLRAVAKEGHDYVNRFGVDLGSIDLGLGVFAKEWSRSIERDFAWDLRL